jgi:chromosome segregation ATPase
MKNITFTLSLLLYAGFVCLLACNPNADEQKQETIMNNALSRMSPKSLDFQRKNDSLMLVIANYLDSITVLQNEMNEAKRKREKTVGVTEMRQKLMEMEGMLGRAQEQINVLEEKLVLQETVQSNNEAQATLVDSQTAPQPEMSTLKLNNAGLKRLLEQLRMQIRQREQEAALARKELKELKVTMNILQTDVAHQEQVVSNKDEELEAARQKIVATEQKNRQIELEKAQAQFNELVAKAKIDERSGDDVSGLFNGKKKKEFYKNALFFYRKAVEIADRYSLEKDDLDSKMQTLNKKLN